MNENLRSMIIANLLEGKDFHQLDHLEFYNIAFPALDTEFERAEETLKHFDFNGEDEYQIVLKAKRKHLVAFVINCNRILNRGFLY
jgi:hypothetical protein